DVTPDRAVAPALIVEHDHLARFDVVDVVADRTGRASRWHVLDGVRAADQALSVLQRVDAEAAARHAQPIQRVGNVRGRHAAESFHHSVSHTFSSDAGIGLAYRHAGQAKRVEAMGPMLATTTLRDKP